MLTTLKALELCSQKTITAAGVKLEKITSEVRPPFVGFYGFGIVLNQKFEIVLLD